MAMDIVSRIENDLGLSRGVVQRLYYSSSSLYSYVQIGNRYISIPSPELKLTQTWISDFVQDNTEALPDYVTAYEAGSCILNNARIHAQNNHLLTLDIKHFFNSCTIDKVARVFSNLRYTGSGQKYTLTDDAVDLLSRLSCHHDSLAVGSPSSPFLANRLFLPVDREIVAELPEGVSYSRYSDDISISSNTRLETDALVEMVSDKLAAHGFSLNESKIHVSGAGSRRRVTGVYLTPEGSCSIGSERKKRIKRELYQFLVHRVGNPSQLMGLLNFCRQIEPNYYNELLAKYASYGAARLYGGVIPALTHYSGDA